MLAFGLLALVAELAGRSLALRMDVGRHVATPSYGREDYYPLLLAGVKVGVALLLARLAWRILRAHAAQRAGRTLLAALGSRPTRGAPRVHVSLSPRRWLFGFAATSLIYLVQADAEGLAAGGRWPLLAPLLHTSALPIFAVLGVLMALVWGAVERWLADYEDYAQATIARAHRLAAPAPPAPVRSRGNDAATPRRLFGLSFESRPPPLPA